MRLVFIIDKFKLMQVSIGEAKGIIAIIIQLASIYFNIIVYVYKEVRD